MRTLIRNSYKRADQKLLCFACFSNYIDPIKYENLMNSFISSQFNNCSLVWMFNDRETNLKLNHNHERALRLVCKDCESELEKLKG